MYKQCYIIQQLSIENKNSNGFQTHRYRYQPKSFALPGIEALPDEPVQIGTNPAVLMGKFSFLL